MEDIKQKINQLISSNKVMLFMKGDKVQPLCGFSAQVLHILNELNISFEVCNVLENEEIREGIKSYSDWPTIPQLYVNKEFIGGCDIVTEMYQSGDLAKLIN